ncbi:MAG TPA: DPP IV N-terminal domain-containing protein [Chthonomonadaceae bacterium]|nr:DPP IV N-terminal domain-containing protein [Chthonomonadaceae bacterium]
MRRYFRSALAFVVLGACTAAQAGAQDRLSKMPGYENYARMSRELTAAARPVFQSGVSQVAWLPDGSGMEFATGGVFYRYDFATRKRTEIPALTAPPAAAAPQRRRGGGGNRAQFVERGRQAAEAISPDGARRAFYRDNNLWMSAPDGSGAEKITTDGSREKRIKYGTGSWVYGEELEQRSAFWWSPDSKRLAYYRFDEGEVRDFYLAMRTLDQQDTLDTEPYPKAGAPNPVVDLFVYDLGTRQSTRVDVRDGKPFANDAIGYYVYDVRWSPDGKELLFNRANRRQNVVELTACNPATGACRPVVRETWSPSWAETHPAIQFLKDGQRFVFASERTGYRNLYLYDLTGRLIAPLTQLNADVESVVEVDESGGRLYYMAHDGDNPMKLQLHRVGLDGKGDTRLTDPALTHRVQVAPDGRHFLDRAEAHDVAPSTRLLAEDGKLIGTLAATDTSRLAALHATPPEVFTYKGGDGKTDCYGMLFRPSNFDPNKRYPLLVDVYGGPENNSVSESYMGSAFGAPETLTELGFLVAKFDGRNAKGRGKAFRDAIYAKLGIAEIDDQAAGVKFLRQRPYVDAGRVGIQGVSYGGYASAMCLLRYPDVFQAACAQSSPTDWRNYDTIYTERYMGLPQENKAAYDAGAAMTYAPGLRGRLMLYFGTADNNVHPSNTLQLIRSLQSAGKSFEVQVGPDQGHSALNRDRMLEFFLDAFAQKS